VLVEIEPVYGVVGEEIAKVVVEVVIRLELFTRATATSVVEDIPINYLIHVRK